MLQQMSYQNYYKSLSLNDWQRLQELFEIAAVDVLPCPALHILHLEKVGYHVELKTGEVFLDIGKQVLDCGNVSNFASLLDGLIGDIAGLMDGALTEVVRG